MYKPLLILKLPLSLVVIVLGLYSSLWLSLFGLLLSLLMYIEWNNTSLIITDDKLIYKTGILTISTSEIYKNQINQLNVDINVLQRILQAGDLKIYTGNDSPLVIKNLYKIKELSAILRP